MTWFEALIFVRVIQMLVGFKKDFNLATYNFRVDNREKGKKQKKAEVFEERA